MTRRIFIKMRPYYANIGRRQASKLLLAGIPISVLIAIGVMMF
jgi:hypothetical protein